MIYKFTTPGYPTVFVVAESLELAIDRFNIWHAHTFFDDDWPSASITEEDQLPRGADHYEDWDWIFTVE
jgi:hypothetical protein